MYTCTIEAFFHEIFLYAILIPMFTIEAIFNQMCSIGAVLIQMYAMDDGSEVIVAPFLHIVPDKWFARMAVLAGPI